MASVACVCEGSSLPEKYESTVATSWESGSLQVIPVTGGSEGEILSALSTPSLTNVIMAGFISDNTLISPHNRGKFYLCRNERNQVEGVALIGHTVLLEVFTERALEAFAAVAHREASPHLLMGERNLVNRFWQYYAEPRQVPRHVCPILFMQRAPFDEQQATVGLRLAVPTDLEHVVRAQAAMVLETSGIDPLQKDPIGFRERYLRRIELKRVWVLMKNGRLIFKTDVLADTPEAAYIEGVYVSPEERGKGLGQRCLTEAGRAFLGRNKAIYLFVQNDDLRTRSFYLKLGFSLAGQYDLLYF
jgi:uncharacterized protein